MKARMSLPTIAATVLLATSACSLALTRSPARDAAPPACRTSWAWPVVDAVLAVAFAVPAIGAVATETEPGSDAEAAKPYYVAGGAILTALAATSATLGYVRVARCRGARERHELARVAPRSPTVVPRRAPAPAVAQPLPPSVAPPEDPAARAKAHGLRGDELYDAGAFDQAIVEYLAAYNLAPRPALLYNLGLTYDQRRDRARALDHYRRYLATGPTGPSAQAARRRITELTSREAQR